MEDKIKKTRGHRVVSAHKCMENNFVFRRWIFAGGGIVLRGDGGCLIFWSGSSPSFFPAFFAGIVDISQCVLKLFRGKEFFHGGRNGDWDLTQPVPVFLGVSVHVKGEKSRPKKANVGSRGVGDFGSWTAPSKTPQECELQADASPPRALGWGDPREGTTAPNAARRGFHGNNAIDLEIKCYCEGWVYKFHL